MSVQTGLSGWFMRHRNYFIVAAVAACIVLPGLGLPEIVDADEGQRAVPPLEMLRSGDWVVPRLNDVPYLKKPPLLYWIIAPLYATFGTSELMARLPTAISCIVLAMLVYHWGVRIASARVALLAGLIVSCNFLVVVQSRLAMLDTPLALFTCATMYCWWRALDADEANSRQQTLYFALGAIWLSCANLLKFPVPLGFLLPAWFCAAIWTRRWAILLNWKAWAAALFSLVPLTLWAAAVVSRIGWGDAVATWKHETHGHYVTATDINSGPVYYYVVRILACFLPWFAGLWFLRSRWQLRALRTDQMTTGYLVGGACLSVFILSVVPAKETFYMLALVPTLSILFATGLDLAFRGTNSRTVHYYAAATCAGYILLTWAVAVPSTVKENRQHSLKPLVPIVAQAVAQKRPVAAHGFSSQPAIYFYVSGPLPELKKAAVAAHLDQPGSLLLISRKRADKLGLKYDIKAQAGDKGDVLAIERSVEP